MTDKAPEAFRTISEVSDELDLPQHVLRFWESKFSVIKPLKRGGGRRYYRPADVELLRGIRHLLYSEGFTIKGVQKILREQGVRHVAAYGREDGDAPDSEPRTANPQLAPILSGGGATGSDRISGQQLRALKSVLKTLREAQARLHGAQRGK